MPQYLWKQAIKFMGIFVLVCVTVGAVYSFTRFWGGQSNRIRRADAQSVFSLNLFEGDLQSGTAKTLVLFGPHKILVNRCAKLRLRAYDQNSNHILPDEDIAFRAIDRSSTQGITYSDPNCFEAAQDFILQMGESRRRFISS